MKIDIIYGPPGTGKTTRLMRELEDILKTYKPYDVAFVSYTRKGVNEGRERAIKKFARYGMTEDDFPYFRTLHSLAFRAINFKRSYMLSKKDYKKFSESTGMRFLGYYTEDLIHNDDRYLFYDLLRRNNPREASKMETVLDASKSEYITLNYKKYKDHNKKYDFTDIIEMYIETGEPIPVKIAIIDEAQDLTTLQWRMIRKAFSACERIIIAGDDEQAIYSWQGADVDYFLNLEGNKEVLDKSYRLPSQILNYSRRFTQWMTTNIEKKYRPRAQGGEVLFYTDLKQVVLNRTESWYMLSRNNCFLTRYDEYLRENKIMYWKKGEQSVDPGDLKKIKIYEERRALGKDLTKDNKILLRSTLKTGFKTSDPWYFTFDWSRSKKLYYQDLFCSGLSSSNVYKIHVNSIHQTKGGEADNVVLLSDVTTAIQKNLEKDVDAELRCMYVACTRARKKLHIVLSKTKKNYDKYLRGIV